MWVSLDFALVMHIKGRSAPRATSLEGRVDVACGHGAALSARPAPGEQVPGQEGSLPRVPSARAACPCGSLLGWHGSGR